MPETIITEDTARYLAAVETARENDRLRSLLMEHLDCDARTAANSKVENLKARTRAALNLES